MAIQWIGCTWFRWWIATTAAFVASYAAFSPIAHGHSGPHDEDLSLDHYASHSVALAIVCVAVVFAQRWALRYRVDLPRVIVAIIATVTAFWIGWWSGIPGLDFTLFHAVLGLASWWRPRQPSLRWCMVTVAMIIISVVGAGIGVAGYFSLSESGVLPKGIMTSDAAHMAFALMVGLGAGVVGGGLGSPLVRPIQSLGDESASTEGQSD